MINYEGYFEYQGSEYCCIEGRYYKDGTETFHSDYAWAYNHYLHYNEVTEPFRIPRKPKVTYVYYLTYYNEYGIKLYETTKRKWVSRFPNDGTLKTYSTKEAASKSIDYRHKYNDVNYMINKIRIKEV